MPPQSATRVIRLTRSSLQPRVNTPMASLSARMDAAGSSGSSHRLSPTRSSATRRSQFWWRADMARALWSGSINFGLVNVPVKAFTAVRDRDVHFHQLDKKSGSRIRYQKVADETGKEGHE